MCLYVSGLYFTAVLHTEMNKIVLLQDFLQLQKINVNCSVLCTQVFIKTALQWDTIQLEELDILFHLPLVLLF